METVGTTIPVVTVALCAVVIAVSEVVSAAPTGTISTASAINIAMSKNNPVPGRHAPRAMVFDGRFMPVDGLPDT